MQLPALLKPITMKTILPIILLCGFFGFSQQTFNLNWQQGINGAAASLNIATGDTVTWTWTNGSPHNVASRAASTESFSSETIAQTGYTYSYTFTQVGTNDYVCTVHPSSMFGTITVSSTMSNKERFSQNLKLFPTTVDSQTQLTSLYEIENVTVYSITGAKVYESKDVFSNIVNFDFSSLNSGMYVMKLNSTQGQESMLKFVKN